MVVLDDEGKPNFTASRSADASRRDIEIRHAAVELPATYFAFDLIAFEDFDLRALPLIERHKLLMEAVPKLGVIRGLDHIPARRRSDSSQQVSRIGLEGIIAKKADSAYRAGRVRSTGSRSRQSGRAIS